MESQGAFLQGALKSLKTLVVGGSQVVEGVHTAVLKQVAQLAPVPAPVPVITQLVYRSIREIASLAGSGAEAVLTRGYPYLANLASHPEKLELWQLHLVSAFNGAFGDHFEREGHPWTIAMGFHRNGRALTLTPEGLASELKTPSPHIVLFLHGLGMNEAGWEKSAEGSFGARLEKDAGCTALWLRYNTGRHIYENGQELARLMETLVEIYPVPVESVTLVGHSMGGLVARSTAQYALRAQYLWPRQLKGICTLGSPHQGAHLENIGNWFSHLLTVTPYSLPLSQIGRLRSAGIKDLRHGSLVEEDWHGRDRDSVESFVPQAVPLIPDVNYLLLASTLGQSTRGPVSKLVGDGLVSPGSALKPRVGDTPEQPGQVTRAVIQGVGHIELLTRSEVYQHLLPWYLHQVRGVPQQALPAPAQMF